MKHYIYIYTLLFLLMGCGKADFNLSPTADDFFFLKNKGAKMPVWVQGNTASKTFIVLLNGGPGGSSFIYNELFQPMTNPLEEDYGMVYWEQRSSGSTQGQFLPEHMTPQQYVEDLEKLIILLQHHYGEDVNFFLMGLSWGGYLSASFLTNMDNQANINGWINVVGPHNLAKMSNMSKDKLLPFAQNQVNLGKDVPWQGIIDWSNKNDSIYNQTTFEEFNSLAIKAEFAFQDSMNMEMSTASVAAQLKFAFASPFDAYTMSHNQENIRNSDLLELAIQQPLDNLLPNIQTPTIIFGGKFDQVVPFELLEEQYELLGSQEKAFHLFEKSGHGLMSNETSEFIMLTKEFIERFR